MDPVYRVALKRLLRSFSNRMSFWLQWVKWSTLGAESSEESPVWNKIGVLPSPPIQGEIMEDVDVQSVHSFSQDKVLVSYKNGVAV
ncbi:hypothetical protein EV368DRAFT_84906 [Lentinula lateritia]|nr:hypothetical protein EV368DRAFT_84906 [Lentinula lateritia]